MRVTQAGDEVGMLNYMAQQEDENGQVRFILASPGTALNEEELLNQVAQQGEPDMVIDGLLEGAWQAGSLHIRIFEDSFGKPKWEEKESWESGGMLEALRGLIVAALRQAEGEVPDHMTSVTGLFQTSQDEAFAGWVEGADALQYIDRSQGMVALDWSPENAYNSALKAVELEREWDAPAGLVIELARRCFQARLGTPEMGLEALNRLQELRGDSAFVLFQSGSFFSDFGDPNKGSELLEKASRLAPEQPAVWTRLGLTQAQLGMPVNAERSLRKAIELTNADNFDPAPYDILTTILGQTNRIHEAPKMWKEVVDAQPQNGIAHAKYAAALMANENRKGAIEFLEKSLTTLDDPIMVKRVYAPLLRQEEDFDRAMDFYEDVLEEAQDDIQLKLEYADTLIAGKREVDAIEVYRDISQNAPDQNTKAQASALLLELEQPQRVKIVQEAAEKAETDVEAAIRDLKPLRNWLADYWKLWVLLASLHNRAGEFGPAEEAANQALGIFPACEPAVNELVNALTGQGKTQEAFELASAAQQAMPQSLPMAIQLGMTAKRVGRDEEARNLARQIREAVGQNDELEPILREMEK